MSTRLTAALMDKGAQAGRQRALDAAEEIRANAAALAPGRLGEALAVLPAADGADLTAPGYARFVEFGTQRQAAQPFLRPALEQVRARARFGGD